MFAQQRIARKLSHHINFLSFFRMLFQCARKKGYLTYFFFDIDSIYHTHVTIVEPCIIIYIVYTRESFRPPYKKKFQCNIFALFHFLGEFTFLLLLSLLKIFLIFLLRISSRCNRVEEKRVFHVPRWEKQRKSSEVSVCECAREREEEKRAMWMYVIWLLVKSISFSFHIT